MHRRFSKTFYKTSFNDSLPLINLHSGLIVKPKPGLSRSLTLIFPSTKMINKLVSSPQQYKDLWDAQHPQIKRTKKKHTRQRLIQEQISKHGFHWFSICRVCKVLLERTIILWDDVVVWVWTWRMRNDRYIVSSGLSGDFDSFSETTEPHNV